MLNMKYVLRLIGFVWIALLFPLLSPSQALTLSFLETRNTIIEGEVVRIDILISEITEDANLAAYSMDILYDPLVVSFDSYVLGTELTDPDWGTDDWSLGDNGAGRLNLSELSWLMDFSTQGDQFILASLLFTGDSAGEAVFSFENVMLGDEFGCSLPDIVMLQAQLVVTGESTNPVPEPATMMLMGIGLMGFAGFRKKP